MQTIILKKEQIEKFINSNTKDENIYLFKVMSSDETDIKPRLNIDYTQPIKDIISAELVIGRKKFELTPEQVEKLNNGEDVRIET